MGRRKYARQNHGSDYSCHPRVLRSEQEELEDKGDQAAVQDPQHHAAEDVGEVVDAQVHAREGDGAR